MPAGPASLLFAWPDLPTASPVMCVHEHKLPIRYTHPLNHTTSPDVYCFPNRFDPLASPRSNSRCRTDMDIKTARDPAMVSQINHNAQADVRGPNQRRVGGSNFLGTCMYASTYYLALKWAEFSV
jgi:hypothetical protein